jgi:hypothetical protein
MTADSNPKLQVTPTDIPDVLVLEPKVFGDNRGWFTESFNANDFNTGVFSNWMNSVAQVNSGQPCGEITTTLTNNVNMTVTQNVVATVMNVTSIAAMAQSMSSVASGMGGSLGNTVSNSESGGSENSGGSKKKRFQY